RRAHVSRPFLAAETYWLNGPRLAEALRIERPRGWLRRCYSPSSLRRTLYDLTVRRGELGALGAETAFEFQYVPVLDTMATERRSLWTLSVAGVVVGCGSWAGWLCLRGG
ncbi:hypothetical protein EV126DRAFT_435331, partial [Verticillium dahliae]